MFRLIWLGIEYGPIALEEICAAISSLRDVEVDVVDLREGGKSHHLTIGPSGFVHETFGARLVVNDIRMLLETPRRPVYA